MSNFKISRFSENLHQNANLFTQVDSLIVPNFPGNVKLFGAKGDGITDDTTAFQAALLSGECLVYVPCGTFLLTDTLAIPSNVAVVGESERLSILQFNNDGVNFNAITITQFSIVKNISINYIGSNSTTSTIFSVIGDSTTVQNVYLSESQGAAFGVSFDAETTANSFSDSYLYGIVNTVRFTDSAFFARFSNNVMSVQFTSTVINQTNSFGGNTFINNYIRGAGGSTTATIGIGGAQSFTSIGNVISAFTPYENTTTATIMDPTNNANSVSTRGRVNIDGIPVLNNQQGAIANDASGAANQATVNAILTALRAHGLIAT